MNVALSEEQLVARQRLLLEVNSHIGAEAEGSPAVVEDTKLGVRLRVRRW